MFKKFLQQLKEFLNLNSYISELDRFLKHFDQINNKLSHSQLKEKEKYTRIYELRDKPNTHLVKKSFWHNF